MLVGKGGIQLVGALPPSTTSSTPLPSVLRHASGPSGPSHSGPCGKAMPWPRHPAGSSTCGRERQPANAQAVGCAHPQRTSAVALKALQERQHHLPGEPAAPQVQSLRRGGSQWEGGRGAAHLETAEVVQGIHQLQKHVVVAQSSDLEL